MDFKAYQGDTFRKELVFTDENDNPVDVSSFSITFKMKKDKKDADYTLVKTATHKDAVNGIAELLITADETEQLSPGRYFFDIELSDGTEVKTILEGRFYVFEDV